MELMYEVLWGFIIGFLLGYGLCKIMSTLKEDWHNSSWNDQFHWEDQLHFVGSFLSSYGDLDIERAKSSAYIPYQL